MAAGGAGRPKPDRDEIRRRAATMSDAEIVFVLAPLEVAHVAGPVDPGVRRRKRWMIGALRDEVAKRGLAEALEITRKSLETYQVTMRQGGS